MFRGTIKTALLSTWVISTVRSTDALDTVVIIAKDNNEFFNQTVLGCTYEADQLNGRCEARFPPTNETAEKMFQKQIEAMEQLIEEKKKENGTNIVGVAISPSADNETVLLEAFGKLEKENITPITFDTRTKTNWTFVGTNNTEMGYLLGKVLEQTNVQDFSPRYTIHQGENRERLVYTIIRANGTIFDDRRNGVLERTERDLSEGELYWEYSGTTVSTTGNDIRDVLYNAINLNFTDDDTVLTQDNCRNLRDKDEDFPNAIVSVLGRPMNLNAGEEFKKFMNKFEACGLKFVCGDSSSDQMKFLEENYVSGLVGQSFYDMGVKSARYLLNETAEDMNKNITTDVIPIIRYPNDLVPVTFDYHYIEVTRVSLCFVLASINIACCIYCFFWTYKNRNTKVVQSAQQTFLYLVAVGVTVWSVKIFFIVIDDEFFEEGPDGFSPSTACTISFAFFKFGFSVISAAFFSKAWRARQISKNSEKVSCVKVSQRGYWFPQVALVGISLALLVAGVSISPFEYRRRYIGGSDNWNRSEGSVGECKAKYEKQFTVAIWILYGCVLIVAIYCGYKSRNLNIDYTEILYINGSLLFLVQIFVFLYPIGLMSRRPGVKLITTAVGYFFINSALLYLNFGMKMMYLRKEIAKKKESVDHVEPRIHSESFQWTATQKLQKETAKIKIKIFEQYMEKSAFPEEASAEEKDSQQKEADRLMRVLVDFQAEIDGVKEHLTACRDRLEKRRSDILAFAEKASSLQKKDQLMKDAEICSRVINKLQPELNYIEEEHYTDD